MELKEYAFEPLRKDEETLVAHHRELELWAENCPENFQTRAALVGAEIARIEGRELDAEHLYEQAIRSAQANGLVHNEAIAYELAARFYAVRGFQRFANAYLLEARYCYQRWGAEGKVRQLEQSHPHLKGEPGVSGQSTTIETPLEQLDLATVLSVFQAVSGEIELGKLIDTLLRTALEHAGAERALLVLPQGEELRVQAEAVTAGGAVTVGLRDAALTSDQLPETVLQYAARSQQRVILEDASAQATFSNDAYIREKGARSILCLPLVKQGRLIAILYLENNLAANVFSARRIAVLNVLASSAAISLENGRLYHGLQEREAKIRRLVDANIVGIFIWDLEGRILEANDAFLRIVGYGREDLVSGRLRWTSLTPPESLERELRQRVPELKATGSVQPFEKEFFRKDGRRVPVLIGGASFEEAGNQGVAFVLDLTERVRANKALQESASRLQHLSRRLLAVQEEERRHLSRELHDEFGQLLATTSMHLCAARESADEVTRLSLDESIAILQLAGAHVRSLALELRPTMLETAGLGSSLRRLAEQHQQRTGIAIHVAGQVSDVSGDLAIACFRVSQEALTNVMRHAGSRQVWIELGQSDGRLELVVRDDGVGFDVDRTLERAASGGHLGLLGMKERVEILGGSLEIDSRPGQGTSIRISLPVAEPVAEPRHRTARAAASA
jgi:PAS domain S-box-containing protein